MTPRQTRSKIVANLICLQAYGKSKRVSLSFGLHVGRWTYFLHCECVFEPVMFSVAFCDLLCLEEVMK
jgi:hypothetical protein